MPALRLLVFGPPRLEREGRVVQIPLRRAQALLVYLAVTGRPHGRDSLAALLWPDGDDREVRARLRRTFHRLAEAVGGDAVLADGDTLCLSPSAKLWLDCRAFEEHAAAGLALPDDSDDARYAQLEHLTRAAALYADDFLAGFSLPDSPAWEEWQLFQREHRRGIYERVLEFLVGAHRARGDWNLAIDHARRWLALDPLHEPAHRALMQLYVFAGQPAVALRQYRECARILDEELGTQPDGETIALYEAIRSRKLKPPAPLVPALASVPSPLPRRPGTSPDPTGDGGASGSRPVGRVAEVAQLHAHLTQVLRGTRRVVLVAGEAGIGKTALVEAFAAEASARATLRIAHGQCLERQGAGEPYMPILEALGRLCHGPDGERLVMLLAQRAPTWLVQMPWLISPDGLAALQSRVLGASRDRMLREMIELLEAVTAEQPLILVLEDLHWADPSTVALLERVARRPEPAQLLVIGTYRPADARTSDYPLHGVVQELRIRGHCEELVLSLLTESAIAAYLGARFPGSGLPPAIPRLLHRRTDGNPLFVVNVVDWWIARGLLVERAGRWCQRADLDELAIVVPDNLRQLVEHQLERLAPEDREMLEVASVVGVQFSAEAVAATLDDTEDAVEDRCAALARQGRFLEACGDAAWPDGTVAAQFGFIHQLYQDVLYERVSGGRRARLHRQVGLRLERGFGDQARSIAAGLAVHFVRGRDPERAVTYAHLAAEQALQRSAHQEAIEHLMSGLKSLKHWPDSPERARRELLLQATLGPALVAARGWSSPEAERALLRAHELSVHVDDAALRSQVLFGLAALHEYRGQYRACQVLMEQRLRLPGDRPDGDYLLESYDLLACSLFHQGAFSEALDQAERGLALYDPDRQYALIATFGEDPGVQCHGWAALSLWFLGHPDRALERAHAGLRLARSHLYSLACAQLQAAWVHQCRLEDRPVRQWAEAAIGLASEQGFPYFHAVGRALRGWALAVQGQPDAGIAELREGLDACRAIGAMIDYPYLLALLAEASGRAGRIDEGLDAVAEGLITLADGRSFFYEAELHRLRGALCLQAGGRDAADEADASFARALDIAGRQRATSLELRALISRSQLWRRLGRGSEAWSALATACDRFVEGRQTPDLKTARALIDELHGGRSGSLQPANTARAHTRGTSDSDDERQRSGPAEQTCALGIPMTQP